MEIKISKPHSRANGAIGECALIASAGYGAKVGTCLFVKCVQTVKKARRKRKGTTLNPTNNIIFLRKQRGWTQKILAKKLGVTAATIGNWERGDARVPFAAARKLVSVFRVKQYEVFPR